MSTVERLTVSREELENTKDAYWSQIIIQRREIAELLKQLTKSEKRRDIEREAREPVADIYAELDKWRGLFEREHRDGMTLLGLLATRTDERDALRASLATIREVWKSDLCPSDALDEIDDELTKVGL
jgi:hypothetical protein